jgi:membrane protein required for colicin V production
MIAGGTAAWLARELIRASGLSGTDRMLGSLFGFARGVLIVGLGVIVIEYAGLEADPWWQDARLRPAGDRIADGIRYYAELGSSYIGSAAG